MKHQYTKEQFVQAVTTSLSVRQTLQKLGIAPVGGNYQTFKRYCLKNSIDTSHFSGQGWSKNSTFAPKRPIEDYLSNKFPIQSFKLKNRLFKEGIFKRICSNCNLTVWLGQPIPLELEHKDGDHENNNLNNLCLLCANCHALTLTYRGKNQQRYRKSTLS